MTLKEPGNSQRDHEYDEIVTAYLKAVEAGERPDPKQWLDQYPDLAGELKAFFAAQQQIAVMAGDDSSRARSGVNAKSIHRKDGAGGMRALWLLVCLVMLATALLGLACVVVGLISLFIEGPFLELRLVGEIVQTTMQKLLFTAFGAVLCLSGIGFWWLRGRGYVVGAVVVYALLVALVFLLHWVSGKSGLISIGWSTP